MGERTQEAERTRDATDLGDVLNDIPRGHPLQEALKDPQRRAVILKRLRERRAQEAAKGQAPPSTAELVDAAEAEVVDGVPTGNGVRYDDDSAIEMTTTAKKHALAYKDGTLSGEHTTTTTTAPAGGEHKDIHERKLKASAGVKGVGAEIGSSDETREGEVAATKERSGGLDVGPEGAKLSGHRAAGVRVGEEDSHKLAHDASLAVDKSGKVTLAAGRSTSREHDGHGDERSLTGNVSSSGDVGVGFGRKRETKQVGADGETHTASRAVDGSAHLGPHGAGLDASLKSTSASGTTQSLSGGAEVDWKEHSASAHAGYSLLSKGGSSLKLSVHAGVQVHAEEPVRVGERYQVRYLVTRNAGGSVGGGLAKGGAGVGVSGGASEARFESGVRSFATEKEAKAFKEHAAEEIGPSLAPDTLAGALMIPVGETRGLGSTSELSGGASLSLEGASLGASAHKSHTHELDVRRVSARLVDVTDTQAGERGADVTASGGLSNTKGESSNRFKAVTWRFDLGTGEGQLAFQKYCQDRVAPTRGARWMGNEDGGGHEEHDKVHVPVLGDAAWTQSTSEKRSEDAAGVHKEFTGGQAHEQTPGWVGRHLFGDEHEHASAEVLSRQENGKEAGYSAVIKVSGESGQYNRDQFKHLFSDGAHNGPAQASGEWTLSADIDKSVVHELEQSSARFKNARSQDDKMRVLSQLIAENGARSAGGLVSAGGHALAWDLELKGDKSFPGRAERERLDALVTKLGADLVRAPAGAAAVLATAQHELEALHARRLAVAASDKYTDLPDELRQEQVKLIDHHVSAFEGLRHGALMETVKNTPGESLERIHARAGDKSAYARLTPEARELARARDHIAETDATILKGYRDVREATRALQQARQHMAKIDAGHKADAASNWQLAEELFKRAVDLDHTLGSGDAKADELRLSLHAGGASLEAARQLAAILEQKATTLANMISFLQLAAEQRKPLTTDNGVAGHEAFWASVAGSVGSFADGDG